MPQRFVVFLVFLVAYFLSYFLRSTNAVIADDLVRDLSLSASQLGFMTSLFFATFAAAQLPLGSALDKFGARWFTPLLMLASVLGCVLFGVGAVVCGSGAGSSAYRAGYGGKPDGGAQKF